MSVDAVTVLMAWLQEHQLVQLAQLEELSDNKPEVLTEPKALLKEMVKRGWLTNYQANKILNDKGQDLLLGPYRILDRLGAGGMGEVYKARHMFMDRVVALKMINREWLSSPISVERFQQEARAAAQLLHPNIVIAHDANQINGVYYFAMEYVEGTDLAKVVHQRGALPFAEACDYARQAALGLQHAFEKGVVHRDIKPSNLLLTQSAGGPLVKILDFGLARFVSEVEAERKPQADQPNTAGKSSSSTRLTQVGSIIGTIDYISPEQAEDSSRADIRSDLFSLGCTLFYLLTRESAYPGTERMEKIRKRIYGDPVPVRNLRADVPPDLEKAILKMLARLAANRYQTPAEVAAALEPFAKQTPKPPALVRDSQRPRRRSGIGSPPRKTDIKAFEARRAAKRRRQAASSSLTNWLLSRYQMIAWLGVIGLALLLVIGIVTSLITRSSSPQATEPTSPTPATKPPIKESTAADKKPPAETGPERKDSPKSVSPPSKPSQPVERSQTGNARPRLAQALC